MKTTEFFLYGDTWCHHCYSPLLRDNVAQVEPGLSLMLLTGTDGKARGAFALYFNSVLKKTEAENYPKANVSRYEFSCQCFVFQLNPKVFLQRTAWQMPWLIFSKAWLAPAFEISTHEIVNELCYILSLKAGFKELSKIVNVSIWYSAFAHTFVVLSNFSFTCVNKRMFRPHPSEWLDFYGILMISVSYN